jgi:hypothetical protein
MLCDGTWSAPKDYGQLVEKPQCLSAEVHKQGQSSKMLTKFITPLMCFLKQQHVTLEQAVDSHYMKQYSCILDISTRLRWQQ